jgi:hypothetical protein
MWSHVTARHAYPLHIVKDNPLAVFVTELEGARAVLGDGIAAAIKRALDFSGAITLSPITTGPCSVLCAPS